MKNKLLLLRIVPTKLVGFSKVELVEEKPKDRRLRRRLANSDLMDENDEELLPIKQDSDPIVPVPKPLNKNMSEQVSNPNMLRKPMTKSGKMVTFNDKRKNTAASPDLLKGKTSMQTDASMTEFSGEGQNHKNVGRRGAIVSVDPQGTGGGQALLNSYQRTRKKSNKKDYLIAEQDEPEDREGMLVQHPDMLKQEPRDYLLIGRVVKRNCRPLTIAEAKHLQRNNVLFKLDAEIRDL